MCIRAVVTDFDGTITSHLDSRIPRAFKKTYKKFLADLQIPIHIATGRPIFSIQNALTRLDFPELNLFPGVYHDGRVVYDADGNILLKEAIPIEMLLSVNEIVSNTVDCSMLVVGTARDYVVGNNISDPMSDFLGGLIDHPAPISLNCVEDVEDFYNDAAIFVFLAGGEANSAICAVLSAHPELVAKKEGRSLMRIALGSSSKCDGVKYLCEALNYEKEDVVVIGDGLNDVEMLTHFPKSIAMGNAVQKVISSSKRVTAPAHYNGWTLGVAPYLEPQQASMIIPAIFNFSREP